MAKTIDELATEITVAWINAVGEACASGKFHGSWLEKDTVAKAYKDFYEAINEAPNFLSE